MAETVAENIQFLEGTPAGLSRAIGLRTPADVPPGTRVRVPEGGTIIFGQFGQAKYHHRKDIRDIRRQLAAGLGLDDIAREIDAHTGGGPDVVVTRPEHGGWCG